MFQIQMLCDVIVLGNFFNFSEIHGYAEYLVGKNKIKFRGEYCLGHICCSDHELKLCIFFLFPLP